MAVVTHAEIADLIPLHWHHFHRCQTGDHPCWDPIDDEDPTEPYEAPACTFEREKAEKAHQRLINNLYGLLNRRDDSPDALTPMVGRMVAYNPEEEIAMVLCKTWAKVEPDSGITKYPASYMASFLDMARAVHDHIQYRAANPVTYPPRPAVHK